MANFDIGGISYQSKLMDGEMQTLVLKRMLPTFTAMINIRGSMGVDDEDSDAAPQERVTQMLMPVARELANISDANVKFILDACLGVTSRQVGTGVGWAPVVQRGIVQDQGDAKFITRLTIAYHVLSENFGDMLGSLGVDLAMIKGMAPINLG